MLDLRSIVGQDRRKGVARNAEAPNSVAKTPRQSRNISVNRRGTTENAILWEQEYALSETLFQTVQQWILHQASEGRHHL